MAAVAAHRACLRYSNTKAFCQPAARYSLVKMMKTVLEKVGPLCTSVIAIICAKAFPVLRKHAPSARPVHANINNHLTSP